MYYDNDINRIGIYTIQVYYNQAVARYYEKPVCVNITFTIPFLKASTSLLLVYSSVLFNCLFWLTFNLHLYSFCHFQFKGHFFFHFSDLHNLVDHVALLFEFQVYRLNFFVFMNYSRGGGEGVKTLPCPQNLWIRQYLHVHFQ